MGFSILQNTLERRKKKRNERETKEKRKEKEKVAQREREIKRERKEKEKRNKKEERKRNTHVGFFVRKILQKENSRYLPFFPGYILFHPPSFQLIVSIFLVFRGI